MYCHIDYTLQGIYECFVEKLPWYFESSGFLYPTLTIHFHRTLMFLRCPPYFSPCWCVSLHLASSSNKFSWHLIFTDTKNVPHSLWCIFSCDQAALWMVQSVCLSVRPSVCLSVRLSVCLFVCLSVRPSHLFDYVPIIVSSWNFRELLLPKTKVTSRQKVKVKVTEVTTQLNRFRTMTPVWIHIWWWNDAYYLIMLRRGALLFFKVICQISRSHGSKNRRIWARLGVSGL